MTSKGLQCTVTREFYLHKFLLVVVFLGGLFCLKQVFHFTASSSTRFTFRFCIPPKYLNDVLYFIQYDSIFVSVKKENIAYIMQCNYI